MPRSTPRSTACKACLPAMKKAGGGTIINIGGLSAHIGSKGRAHVMTAKAALVGFSRALAHDLAADRITANCVVPGAIDTTRPGSSSNPAHHLTHGTITGERGKPDDVAAMVRFLAGPGGRYVTGQAIHVSGGAFLGSDPAGRTATLHRQAWHGVGSDPLRARKCKSMAHCRKC